MRSRTFRWSVSLLAAAVLVSCATAYQREGFSGGYSDVRLDSKTYRVTFRGNAYTSRQTAEIYLLYRCAELTASGGHDYFVIVSGGTEATHDVYTTPSTYTSTTTASVAGFGNTAYGSASTTGTYSPGSIIYSTKYGTGAVIKVFKGEKPTDHPAAFSAREILQYVGPQIRR